MPRTPPFLDTAWLGPGSFTGLVDMGLSRISKTLPALDRVATDDIALADVAVAAAVYDRATAEGIGRILPL